MLGNYLKQKMKQNKTIKRQNHLRTAAVLQFLK